MSSEATAPVTAAAAAPASVGSADQTAPPSDFEAAAQTITELATAATNAANSVSGEVSTTEQPIAEAASSATQHPDQAAIAQNASAANTINDADKAQVVAEVTTGEPNAEARTSATEQDGVTAPAAAAAAEETTFGLPRSIESELRDIYSVSSAIANFCVAHVNQVNVPTPQKVRTIIQKALKLTSSLSMLLAQPEVALRQLDADEHGKRPAESKLDSARKRQRSSDWDGNKVGPGTPGLPMAPYTPNSGLRVFPDGSLPTSFPSAGFDGDGKGPQYKKRSRAPAPGSCQACGTSETPEWRRGPDGARTLCNACGLHYAKLVRKRMQQEGVEEPSPSHAQAQVSLVSLEELRASTKSAEAAAAAGLTSSGSSSSLNEHQHQNSNGDEMAPPPPAPETSAAQTSGIVEPGPTPAIAEAQQHEQQQQPEQQEIPDSVIAPELANESVPATITATAAASVGAAGDERPMETDQ
uniref:GATA-type domain-containing protein n=1 Tax=Melanopsichium pennsylvanicum 4 TaxID=1398559 RepID=A0A077RDA8_9BASI|nr:putative protein [Melanopsichium pennsylvanicum 4]